MEVGIRPGKERFASDLGALAKTKTAGGFALNRLLEDGAIDDRQRAAGMAYAEARRRFDASGGAFRPWKDSSGLADMAWQALKREHAALLRATGAERFILDRLCLEGEAPLRCEAFGTCPTVGRVADQFA